MRKNPGRRERRNTARMNRRAEGRKRAKQNEWKQKKAAQAARRS